MFGQAGNSGGSQTLLFIEGPSSEAAPAMTARIALTCFFDPSHGPGVQNVLWTPQWGIARNVQTCPACAQRWAAYQQERAARQAARAAQAQGYPQPGYVQQGYPQPGVYGPGYDPGYGPGYAQPQRQGPGWGGVAAAGAAGLVGGMLIEEMLDDDDHHGGGDNVTVINEYDNEYVDNDYGDQSGFDNGGYDDGGGFDDGGGDW
jgi:hypothetical protein